MSTSFLIPIGEAAKRYGVGYETMRLLVAQGFFPFAMKAGGRYVIERAPFEAHLVDPCRTRKPATVVPMVRRRRAS